ncbi:SOCS box domain-containing protein [Trichonephila clavata]|uniref:SOCS box domain-containing protein n=1 Tax=Trichonephila clavata TaxID=2740835 RepID=A0A8X6K695_TRICU|nr:SOCS box domain-containing protein [Trichonephila clavata]
MSIFRDPVSYEPRKKLRKYASLSFSESKRIQYENVKLRSAVDVVRYSFIAHKSVTYLDLSVGEYGKLEKQCFTKDAYKNEVLSSRYVLYSYHLDVSRKLDDNISKIHKTLYDIRPTFKCFFLKKVSVVDESVYKLVNYDKSLAKIAVQKSNNKIRTLMKLIEFFSVDFFYANFIPYLELIIKEGHSELVCQFLQISPHLMERIFVVPHNPALLDLVLYHTTRANCRIFNEELDWSYLVFSENYECFYQLIKYGYILPGNFLCHLRDFFQYQTCQDLSRNVLFSHRRLSICLLTNLFLLWNKMAQRIDLVKLLWQAIPDPFFTRFEINQAVNYFFYSGHREKFIRLYETNISGYLYKPIPRSLFHLCRCSIREHMGALFQLPHGIDKLTIPEKLKKYLRLNIPY